MDISNVKVYDLKESVIACRNAMRLEVPEYTDEEFEASLKRAIKLCEASKGPVKCQLRYKIPQLHLSRNAALPLV